jgi:hypothetical protein
MIGKRHLPIAVVLLALGCATARAQEAGRVGVTMESPVAIGLIWHISDRVAVRPDVALSHSSGTASPQTTTSISSTSSNNDATTVTVGVSGRLRLAKWDALSAYVSPRFAYARQSATTSNTITISVPNTIGLLVGGTSLPSTMTSTFDSLSSILHGKRIVRRSVPPRQSFRPFWRDRPVWRSHELVDDS